MCPCSERSLAAERPMPSLEPVMKILDMVILSSECLFLIDVLGLDTIYLTAIDHDIIVLIAYDVKDIRFLLLECRCRVPRYLYG